MLAFLAILRPFLPWILAGGVGFGAAIAYEHKAPWALGPRLERLQASIPTLQAKAAKVGMDAQSAADAAKFKEWAVSLTQCRADAQTARDSVAAAIGQSDSFTRGQAATAYALGRASCGGSTHAPSPTGGSRGSQSGGVPGGSDFAHLFEPGAFTPASEAPVPGGGSGPAQP